MFYIGIGQDITKRKDLEKMKSEFITIASHQLRTPLTSIKWVIELFSKKEKLTKQGQEYLNDIHEAASNLTELVNILLNVSRIEEGNVGIYPKRLELVGFLENYLNNIEHLYKNKKITVSYTHPKEIISITDSRAFRNIIQSLISNSIEYTPEGGKIDITLDKKNDLVLLKIEDNGIGIPKDEQENIAKKFTRGSNAKLIKTDGTGMGLYIAYKAVELLGGKIWFESSGSNKGTTFYVQLPVESSSKEGTKNLI